MAASAVQQRVWFYMGKKEPGYQPDIALEALRFYAATAEPMSADCWCALFGLWAIVTEGVEPDHNHSGAEKLPTWFSFLVGYYREQEINGVATPMIAKQYLDKKINLELVSNAVSAGAAGYRLAHRIGAKDSIKETSRGSI